MSFTVVRYMLHIGLGFKCTLRKDCIIDRSDFVYIQYSIGNTNWDFTEGIGMYAENPGICKAENQKFSGDKKARNWESREIAKKRSM